MRLNEHTVLRGEHVVLVPYRYALPLMQTRTCARIVLTQVETYHAWMQDPALQAQTASEPLTLDEEYAMQQSWHDDGDSVCSRLTQNSLSLCLRSRVTCRATWIRRLCCRPARWLVT